jgi:predicted NACHT family NTPase
MASEFSQKLSDESAKNLVQLALSLGKKIGRAANDEIKIRKATDKYAENYLRRYCQVKILGMSEPVALNSLYTEVQLVDARHRNKAKIIADLEDNFRKSRGDFNHGIDRISGLLMANEKSMLNVLGPPGSGKSTFLKKIGLDCLTYDSLSETESYLHKCIPVLIELKRFKAEFINLKQLIQTEFEIAGFPESSRFLDRALVDGKLLILLDGLDEVPESKLSDVLDHIKDFTDKYHNNRFITSCRTAFYKSYLTGFTDIEITSFNDDQIKQFVLNWFSLEKDTNAGTANLFISLLFQHGNESSLELSRTPLLLAFLCMTFDQSQRFPANRASLYKQALLILMQKWASEKRIHNDDIYQELTVEVETEMLADVAAFFYSKDEFFFNVNELKTRVKEFLDKRIGSNNLNPAKILNAIELQQGILTERSFEIYSFSHLTIQEYLTAHFFNSPIRIHELIEKYLFDKRWREVFLLLTGAGDPNDILLLMTKKLVDYAEKNEIVRNAIKWADSVELKSTTDQGAIERTFLVSLIIRYKRYDTGFGPIPKRIEIYADDLIRTASPAFYDFFVYDLKPNISAKQANYILDEVNKWLKKPKDYSPFKNKISSFKPEKPLSKVLMGSRQKFRRQIIDEFYRALEIPNDLCNRKRDVYNPILKYMEACTLVIQCAKDSTLTSKEVLRKIQRSIFSFTK